MTDAFPTGSTAISTEKVEPRRPAPPWPPRLIETDDQAIKVAEALAEKFRAGASERDRERRLPWEEIELYT